MVMLQKQLSRKVGKKEYAKYVLVIPPKDIEITGFKSGEELIIKSSKGKIIISKDQ
jgi:hypothetical protein